MRLSVLLQITFRSIQPDYYNFDANNEKHFIFNGLTLK